MNELNRPTKRALLSVSDKSGLIDFAKILVGENYELLSTGGTSLALKQAGLNVTDVSAVTGFPEIMNGRVKTLHPKIHGGLLAVRDNPDHSAECHALGIGMIDLLAVNLYPFEQVLAAGGRFDELIENIDVGGPAMIRAAAKNHTAVTVIIDPADYATIGQELVHNGGVTLSDTRKRLAAKAFARTAAYDSMISNWFLREVGDEAPAFRAFGGPLIASLRYGENPHQSAGFYRTGEDRPGVATARLIQGKDLSYNNLNDTDCAFECVAEFGDTVPACIIVKHASPCGAACGRSLAEAYRKALACDPISAFGGVLAFNREIDSETASEIVKLFTEVVIAPGAEAGALSIFAQKQNLRLLLTRNLPDAKLQGWTIKSVAGGFLVQSRDQAMISPAELKVVTKRSPTQRELEDLLFAWKIGKHVKSNAIVLAKDLATVGIGGGQTSRLDAARMSARNASQLDNVTGSVAASDAFFPFADALLVVAEAGASAVIQPGGSVRDEEVIEAANNVGLAMVFTSMRHFKH